MATGNTSENIVKLRSFNFNDIPTLIDYDGLIDVEVHISDGNDDYDDIPEMPIDYLKATVLADPTEDDEDDEHELSIERESTAKGRKKRRRRLRQQRRNGKKNSPKENNDEFEDDTIVLSGIRHRDPLEISVGFSDDVKPGSIFNITVTPIKNGDRLTDFTKQIRFMDDGEYILHVLDNAFYAYRGFEEYRQNVDKVELTAATEAMSLHLERIRNPTDSLKEIMAWLVDHKDVLQAVVDELEQQDYGRNFGTLDRAQKFLQDLSKAQAGKKILKQYDELMDSIVLLIAKRFEAEKRKEEILTILNRALYAYQRFEAYRKDVDKVKSTIATRAIKAHEKRIEDPTASFRRNAEWLIKNKRLIRDVVDELAQQSYANNHGTLDLAQEFLAELDDVKSQQKLLAQYKVVMDYFILLFDKLFEAAQSQSTQ